ncbi:MAG: hypothetical protein DRQ39_03705 [Gammaproteobacteria bacterium]|nr:MAG: hypothetical protein DRQ39_03705 [Gammaproteobacteria bacterium]
MSIENEIKKLTAAIEAQTLAIVASSGASVGVGTAQPSNIPVAQPTPAPLTGAGAFTEPQNVVAPQQPAATVIQPVAPAQPEVGALTLDSVNQAMVAKSQSIPEGVPKILQLLSRFAGATKLNEIPQEHWPVLMEQLALLS